MKKIFHILTFFLFFAIGTSSALAGLSEEIDQLSPQEAKEILEKLQTKAKTAEKTESGVKVAVFSPALGSLNSFLTSRGSGSMPSSIYLAGGVYKHNFTPQFQVGISYMGGGTGTGSKTAAGDVFLSSVNLNVIELTAAYKLEQIPFQPFLEGGIGYYNAGYDISSTPAGGATTLHKWSGSAIGERVGLGVRYVQRDFFGFSFVADVDVNYVFANIGSVNEAGVTDPAAAPIDLNGFLFRLGGQISF